MEEILVIDDEGKILFLDHMGKGTLTRKPKITASTANSLLQFAKDQIQDNLRFVRFDTGRMFFLKSQEFPNIWALAFAELSQDPRILISRLKIILGLLTKSVSIGQLKNFEGYLRILHREILETDTKHLVIAPHTPQGIMSVFVYIALLTCLGHSLESFSERLYLVSGEFSYMELSIRVQNFAPDAIISLCDPGTIPPILPICELDRFFPGEDSMAKIAGMVAGFFPFIFEIVNKIYEIGIPRILGQIPGEFTHETIGNLAPQMKSKDPKRFLKAMEKELKLLEEKINEPQQTKEKKITGKGVTLSVSDGIVELTSQVLSQTDDVDISPEITLDKPPEVEQPRLFSCSLENVERTYKMGDHQINALKELNLKLESGQLVIVLGPSGSGKTTLLNLLGGIDTLTAGKIRVGDHWISELSKGKLTEYRRTNVGFIFQFFNLLPIYTALENVEYAVELSLSKKKKMTRQEVRSKALEYLEAVGMAGKEDLFPSRMSGGEQQRVAAARAFAKEPQLLLCDEPTGELSSREGKKVLSVIQNMVKIKPDLLALLVTHNQKIAQIGNRVIRLRSGMIDTISTQEPVSAETISW